MIARRLPRNWTRDPDTSVYPDLAQLRLHQWRGTSHNPFKDIEESTDEEGSKPAEGRSSERPQLQLKNPGSRWIILFNDLAWSASFVNLTENGKFATRLDPLNYFLFFIAVLWLWLFQTFYSIHFYTNDMFHLLVTFFQLFIFGMLSATTLGYDVTTYIGHSPGLPILQKSNDNDDPEAHADAKAAHLSMVVLAAAFAATRVIHLAQYLRVLYYANFTVGLNLQNIKKHSISRIPLGLQGVAIGLAISTPMFIAALVITASSFGGTVLGASLKLGLWFGGFLVEVISQFSVPVYHWIKGRERQFRLPCGRGAGGSPSRPAPLEELSVPTNSNVKLSERLQVVTSSILGEASDISGISGVAGTLSKVLAAPGVGRVVAIHVASAASAIWFIAFIYFEGPKGELPPASNRDSPRYIIWLLLHLPFLSAVVLLLIGIKSQFLLTGFLSSLSKTVVEFDWIIKEQLIDNLNATYWENNAVMKNFLLDRGLVWKEECQKFWDILGNATQGEQPMALPDFNEGDDNITRDLQPSIDNYNTNFTLVAQDLTNRHTTNPREATYYQILSRLLGGYILSTRYILAFAALILIILGLQDLFHSPPRDRYQFGVIINRFLMGTALSFLLLLNIGKYQELYVPDDFVNQRAGVFLWLDAFWVLPTIAIAYAIEFLIEMIWARFAKRATRRVMREISSRESNVGIATRDSAEKDELFENDPVGGRALRANTT